MLAGGLIQGLKLIDCGAGHYSRGAIGNNRLAVVYRVGISRASGGGSGLDSRGFRTGGAAGGAAAGGTAIGCGAAAAAGTAIGCGAAAAAARGISLSGGAAAGQNAGEHQRGKQESERSFQLFFLLYAGDFTAIPTASMSQSDFINRGKFFDFLKKESCIKRTTCYKIIKNHS